MKLREIREARGISQRKAAADLGMSPTVYNRYETGAREPALDVLQRLAEYFGVSIDYLIGREDLTPDIDDDVWEVRERLRRDPNFRILFDASKKATAENLRAAAAMLKALEPPEYDE